MHTLQPHTAPSAIEWKLGIVMSVDPQRGLLTLRHRGGTCSHLNADPSLLGDLKIGGPVLVRVDRTIVRSLRRL